MFCPKVRHYYQHNDNQEMYYIDNTMTMERVMNELKVLSERVSLRRLMKMMMLRSFEDPYRWDSRDLMDIVHILMHQAK